MTSREMRKLHFPVCWGIANWLVTVTFSLHRSLKREKVRAQIWKDQKRLDFQLSTWLEKSIDIIYFKRFLKIFRTQLLNYKILLCPCEWTLTHLHLHQGSELPAHRAGSVLNPAPFLGPDLLVHILAFIFSPLSSRRNTPGLAEALVKVLRLRVMCKLSQISRSKEKQGRGMGLRATTASAV